MHIKWLRRAVDDLIQVRRHIAADRPQAAGEVAERIVQAVELLQNNPGMGRPGRVSATRELIIAGLPYIIPYRVRSGSIEILRVLHAARRWPASFQD